MHPHDTRGACIVSAKTTADDRNSYILARCGLYRWAIPQVFIVAELATAFSGPHGGAVRWVGEGLGDVAGLANAMILHVREYEGRSSNDCV